MVSYTPVGEMTELVELLRATRTKDSTGQEVLAWTAIQTMMAKVMPFTGREVMYAKQVGSDITYRVNFPYYPAIEPDQRVLAQRDSTTLTTTMNDSVTSMVVADHTQFSPKGSDFYVKIDDEIIRVTAGQGTSTFTVTRGQLGTSAAAHTSGKYIIDLFLLEVKYVSNVNQGRVETELLCAELGSEHAV